MDFLNTLLPEVPVLALLAGVVVVLIILGYTAAPIWLWAVAGFALLSVVAAPVWVWVVFAVLVVLFVLPPIRQQISKMLMRTMERLNFLPTISATEKEAIDAGTVWVEGELFSGKPDFKKILSEPFPELTAEEQAFLDGPTKKLGEMTDDWDVFQRKDLPPEVWEYIKKEKFFGLIIPKEYGGHGFSALANSAIVANTGSISPVLAITVMVPNSLGPAELLIHYGTKKQKDYYLPRLARGEDVPAFALTEPNAGSDAGAIEAQGVVFRNDEGVLCIRLNWNKRYITLAAISTVLGLAFKLKDPDNLLGKGQNLGITCALIPTDTPGVDLTRRHDPMGIPFYNCPTQGRDVVLVLEDAVIGGVDGIGKGWRMLMESLAAGRGISLPATSTGGIKHCARAASAHSVVRRQFGLSIGKFEGIEEPLARLGGWTYLLDSARRFTCGGIDAGAKPAVVTAMAKYNFTELFRKGMNDAMDVLGGNAISRGPRNVLAHGYTNLPISITVEGANILTRTLMIFGQGAIRCHPYAITEIQALETKDHVAFDRAFAKHIGHVVRNTFRSIVLGWTRGVFVSVPSGTTSLSKKYMKKISWASARFALLSDIAMGTLGGDLKRKEKLTGRFADVFSWLYLASAVIRRYEAEDHRKEDKIFAEWALQFAMNEIQTAFEGIYANIKVPGLTWAFRGPLTWWVRVNPVGKNPSDDLGHKVAKALQVPGAQRDRLLSGTFVSDDPTVGIARTEHAMKAIFAAEEHLQAVKQAYRAGLIQKGNTASMVADCVEKGVLSADQAKQIKEAEILRDDAVQVDSFTLEEYMQTATRQTASAGDGALHQADMNMS